jgi:hypothetical protein
MIGDEQEFEPGSLGHLRVLNQLVRFVLFAG